MKIISSVTKTHLYIQFFVHKAMLLYKPKIESKDKRVSGADLESILTVAHKGVVGNIIRDHTHSF